jgi:hypothetical protein
LLVQEKNMHIKTEWNGQLWVIQAVVNGALQEFAAKRLDQARALYFRAKAAA